MEEDFRDPLEKAGLSAHSQLFRQIREQLGKAAPEDLERLIRHLVARDADILQGKIRDKEISARDAIASIRSLTVTKSHERD